MSISFKDTEMLLQTIDDYMIWEEKQKERSKKINNLKKKIYENSKK